MSNEKILIFGGRGALGSACVKYFKKKGWWTCSIDHDKLEEPDANIIVNFNDDLLTQSQTVHHETKEILKENKFDVILCVAGGWAGGNTKSADFVKNTDTVLKQSVWSSVIAASIAAHYLKTDGLVVMCGADIACQPTPKMVGYGMAKAAVHHLVKSMGESGSGMPLKSTSLAILPSVLDTPMNRKMMPKADTSTWTPLEYVAELFYKWSQKIELPASGSLVQLTTKDGITTFNTI